MEYGSNCFVFANKTTIGNYEKLFRKFIKITFGFKKNTPN